MHFVTDCFGHRSKCLSLQNNASHLSITLLLIFPGRMFQLVLLNVSNVWLALTCICVTHVFTAAIQMVVTINFAMLMIKQHHHC